MLDEKTEQEILKALRTANKQPYLQESLTEIYAYLKLTNPSYPMLVRENFYDLIDYLAVLKGEQFRKICRPDRRQVDQVTNILTGVNLEKTVDLSSVEITNKINLELQKEKVDLILTKSDEINQIILRVKALEAIKRAIRLVNNYEHTLEIYQYCKKFSQLSSENIKTELSTIEGVIDGARLFIPNEEKSKKISMDYLTTQKYPMVALQDKNASDLLNIVERHYLGGIAVLATKIKHNSDIIHNQNELIDATALFLLDQEDLRETD